MTTRVAVFMLLSVTVYGADAPDEKRPARPAPITIRWVHGAHPAVEIMGLDKVDLSALAEAGGSWDSRRWAEVLAVSVVPARAAASDAPPMVGTYRVAGDVLRFEPRFAFEPGLHYRAHLRTSRLPQKRSESVPDIMSDRTWPVPEPGVPTRVTRVDPTVDRLPENLLKFYLHFSKPMSRGKAYGHVRILDATGQALKVPFLELGEELWDPSGTRLTLLLDPGRIKRGLRPREEEGPILEAGKAYTFVIDREWPDAEGHPLREAFRKPFRAGEPDETQPDPKTWKVTPPAAGSTDPLTLTFPEPLDRAMLDRAIVLQSADGNTVAGRLDVNPEGTRWQFRPERPWAAGSFQLIIDAELEDLAGNSIARPFEVDVLGPITRRKETPTVTLPVLIGAKP